MFRTLMFALAGALLTWTAGAALAQEDDAAQKAEQEAKQKAELQAKYEAKVSESWFKDGGFTDDYETALARSKETGKPIFTYFTRSYAG